MNKHSGFSATIAVLTLAIVAIVAPDRLDAAQVPTLTPPQGQSTPANADEVAAPTSDNPEATVTEGAGTIDVAEELDVDRVREFLEHTLSKIQGVYQIHAEVDGHVVTLTGHVEDETIRDRCRGVALKVQGVVFVINQLKTDAQVLSAGALLAKRFQRLGTLVARNWLSFLSALLIVAAGFVLARLFAARGELILRLLSPNPLLRSVLNSLISIGIIFGGIFLALQVFGIAEAVLSVLGLAGVAAVALGFAFREIAENFIASILLGARRPFKIGDYVEVAGQSGVVQSLNTRATVLVTLDGRHVRIPNARVFKEIMINSTTSPSIRGSFDVIVPHKVSAIRAQETIAKALKGQDALLADPAPRVLVEGLSPQGVTLRAYFWYPTRGVDKFKLLSDARLKAKVALQEAGIAQPADTLMVSVSGPIALARTPREPRDEPDNHRDLAAVEHADARAELRRDAQAAEAADDSPGLPDEAMRHVLNLAAETVNSEGENLLDHDDAPEPAPAKSP